MPYRRKLPKPYPSPQPYWPVSTDVSLIGRRYANALTSVWAGRIQPADNDCGQQSQTSAYEYRSLYCLVTSSRPLCMEALHGDSYPQTWGMYTMMILDSSVSVLEVTVLLLVLALTVLFLSLLLCTRGLLCCTLWSSFTLSRLHHCHYRAWTAAG